MQISHSRNGLWLDHLQGARDLILFRGGPRTANYLTRFFSFLDISRIWSVSAGFLVLIGFSDSVLFDYDNKSELRKSGCPQPFDA